MVSYRKISAVVLLLILLVTPFFNWRLGAIFWLCAWILYLMQGLFGLRRRSFQFKSEAEKNEEEDKEE